MQKNAFNEQNTQQVDYSRNGNNIIFSTMFYFSRPVLFNTHVFHVGNSNSNVHLKTITQSLNMENLLR